MATSGICLVSEKIWYCLSHQLVKGHRILRRVCTDRQRHHERREVDTWSGLTEQKPEFIFWFEIAAFMKRCMWEAVKSSLYNSDCTDGKPVSKSSHLFHCLQCLYSWFKDESPSKTNIMSVLIMITEQKGAYFNQNLSLSDSSATNVQHQVELPITEMKAERPFPDPTHQQPLVGIGLSRWCPYPSEVKGEGGHSSHPWPLLEHEGNRFNAQCSFSTVE